MPNTVIVQSHHHVLPAWAEYRASLDEAPRLITLDHHTDTASPFRQLLLQTAPPERDRLYREWISALDFRNTQSIKDAVLKLNNDEHITTAIHSNIIASAFVIAHNAQDTDEATYKEHKIMCRAVDRAPGSRRATRADCDQVLEAQFLNEMIESFDRALNRIGEDSLEQTAYILDIDLDYFNTHLSIAPRDDSTLRKLARNAGLITVATEPDYVKHCALDMGLTSEFLLKELSRLLK